MRDCMTSHHNNSQGSEFPCVKEDRKGKRVQLMSPNKAKVEDK